MTELSPPRIVCAAIRHTSGAIVCGPRHFDPTMYRVLEQLGNYMTWRGAEQGFIDQHGNFLTRQEAWMVAWENNQVRRRVPGDEGTLYSENLY